MTERDFAERCIFCGGPVHPDPKIDGALYCANCAAPVAVHPDRLDAPVVLTRDIVIRYPELVAGFCIQAAGLEKARAAMVAVRDGEFDEYILRAHGREFYEEFQAWQAEREEV